MTNAQGVESKYVLGLGGKVGGAPEEELEQFRFINSIHMLQDWYLVESLVFFSMPNKHRTFDVALSVSSCRNNGIL